MIGSLRGVLAERHLHRDGTATVIVEVNGVGYELAVDARHYQDLPALNSTVAMSVHTHMREGSLTLYGFADRDERDLFELLLGAHGVGPAMALAILGSMSTAELVSAVSSGDVKTLTQVPGVGMKTAQRLILELAQRIDAMVLVTPQSRGEKLPDRKILTEVSEALGALGYGNDEIRTVMRELGELNSVDDLLRAALSQLAPRR
jgi:Holliday junction DNA helicase RuvA